MSIPSTVGVREGNGKLPAQDSLREISRRYNVDGIDDEDVPNVSALRRNEFTKYDQKDMNRMGKRQELMVSQLFHPFNRQINVVENFSRETSARSLPLVSPSCWWHHGSSY